MGSSSSKEERVSPKYPVRYNAYNVLWANDVLSRARVQYTDVFTRSDARGTSEDDSTASFEKLEKLVDEAEKLYESIGNDDAPAKLKALFACLGQVWSGICFVRAVIALCEEEKSEFDAITAHIDQKFTELRARDSVIRLRKHTWEIQRLLNRPVEDSTSQLLDREVNGLMQELIVEGICQNCSNFLLAGLALFDLDSTLELLNRYEPSGKHYTSDWTH
jgi:hypothetical protein